MLKAVLVLAGLVFAAALVAPDYLSRLTNRSQPAVVVVSADIPTQSEYGSTVRLSADRRGHYIADIEVNDRPLNALVDTGATVVALRYEDARDLALILPGDAFDVRVQTANGHARARRVMLRSVRLGPITVHDVPALVMDEDALSDNLLGMSFLRELSRFQVERDTLVLEQ